MNEMSMYVLRNVAGEVIYVGVARSWLARLAQHRSEKPWWWEVHHVDVEYFDTREAALRAERETIRKEAPIYNVLHNGDNAGREPQAHIWVAVP